MYVADLHIHSKYSRATSRDCDAAHLDFWARRKGLGLLGTGDFTHPAWRKELRDALEEAGDGVYRVRREARIPCPGFDGGDVRFVLSGEISTIYKKDGKTRKVHHVILLPSLEAAEELSRRLEAIGNLHSDGRPILGLDSRDLLEITMESCPEAIFIPAHIWTPHFSLFGAFSQFSTIEECYGDMTRHIHALETGLSSDPPMNRMLSALDGYQLVSNSDAHSPARLAREANLLDGTADYPALRRALETGDGLRGTIEFFPEEGKYHLDGHRACKCLLEPAQTDALGGRCPVCGRKLTVGVQHRVTELADRDAPKVEGMKPFESLMPLPELLGDAMGASAASKKVLSAFETALQELGSELYILREAPISDMEKVCGALAAEALRRLRAGKVFREAGYDGEYGKITLFAPGEREELRGQMSFLDPFRPAKAKEIAAKAAAAEALEEDGVLPENPEQQEAIRSEARALAVIAGPGTGKTYTLTERVAHLIGDLGVKPSEITAVTFTNQAANELRERLEARLGGKKAVKGLNVGTFHAICLGLLGKKPLAGHLQQLELMADVLAAREETISPAEALRRASARRNGVADVEIEDGILEDYRAALDARGLRDLDDVLEEALEIDVSSMPMFSHLLVDEFQDINALQRRLVAHWIAGGGSLFVIGDPDQSIYGFRGANARCFDELRELLPELKTIVLTKNYRSAPSVLECAMRVIGKNPGGERRLIAMRGGGEPVRVVSAPDLSAEGYWIAREIARLAGGVDMNSAVSEDGRAHRAFSDMAVLCRTRRQLMQIEKALGQEGIPCVIAGRDDSLEGPEAQGIAGFFRSLLGGDGADSALRHVFHAGDEDRARAAAALAEYGWDFAALHAALDAREALKAFLDAAEALRMRVAKEKSRKLLEDFAVLTGVTCPSLLEAALFHRRMAELVEALDGGETDVRRLCGGGYASGAVQLMTLHGCKGLEFPVVFLAGAADGELPLRSHLSPADPEEERRLFFVGITRAREELIVSYAGEASEFLDDLPENVQKIAATPKRKVVAYEQLSFF